MMRKQNFSDVFFSKLVLNCFFFPLEVCKILLYTKCFPNYKPTHELAILSAYLYRRWLNLVSRVCGLCMSTFHMLLFVFTHGAFPYVGWQILLLS